MKSVPKNHLLKIKEFSKRFFQGHDALREPRCNWEPGQCLSIKFFKDQDQDWSMVYMVQLVTQHSCNVFKTHNLV